MEGVSMSAKWMSRMLFVLAVLAHSGIQIDGSEGNDMGGLSLQLDGSPVELSPISRRDGEEALVPLAAFCDVVGAESKVLDGAGMLAVCRDDLCIPLAAADTASKPDFTIAIVWLRRASDAKSLEAPYLLGQMARDGKGKGGSPAAAAAWFEISGSRGYAPAYLGAAL